MRQPVNIALFSCVFLLMLLGMAGIGQGQEQEGWFAGVASVDITPEESMWMAGYASRNHGAEGLLLPLKAKALALQDGDGNQGLILTVDLVGASKEITDRIFASVKEKLGLERHQVVFSASHTHSGPVADNSLRCIYPYDDSEARKIEKYAAVFLEKIVAAAEVAFDNLRAVSLYGVNGVARFAVNRRNNQESALTATMALEGPQDHAVPVLKVTDQSGKLYAVLFGYACHATVLDGYLWSGDYHGFAQAAMEERYPDATALFFAGCGADMNPLPRRQQPLVRQYGETLASAVAARLDGDMKALAPVLKMGYDETVLAMLPPPDKESLEEQVATSSGYVQQCSQQLLDQLEAEGSFPESYVYPLQGWIIGDLPFAMLAGEPVVEYALAIKEVLGQDSFVMGYANDYVSYIPSERILAEGGYEGCQAQMIFGLPSCWAPGLEEKIVTGMCSLLTSLD